MTKSKPEVKSILIKEWYTQEGEDVYLWWRLPNRELIKRLTPFKMIPIVELNLQEAVNTPLLNSEKK